MEFASPEVAQAYKQRVQMVKDVVELKRPERVPVIPWIGVYPAEHENAETLCDGLDNAVLRLAGCVITSYSIHYTKLYDWQSSISC